MNKIKTYFFELFKKLKPRPGQTVKFAVVVKSFNPEEVKLVIYKDGKAVVFSKYHTGGGYYETLSIRKKFKRNSALKFGIEYKNEILVYSAKVI